MFFFLLSFFAYFYSFLSLLFSDIFSLFLLSNGLASDMRMRSDRLYVQYLRGSLSWVASVIIGVSRREYWDVCISMDLAPRKLTSDFHFSFMFLAEAWIASAVISACVPPLICLCFALGIQLQSD